ncbi:MAG: methionine aminotransferase [Candidatus Competibacteraceae bacterium]|nr:methionine aminotransferase [Candidatus Competibacteraceae bacterium]
MIYSGNIESKLPRVKTTIFTVMSALAKQHQAINLSQGFPDFQVDKRLVELVTQQMLFGKNQYAPMQGVYELREAIALKTEEIYSATYDPDSEITVTAGATQALFTAISAFVREGDEVIVIEPAYDCYVPAIELNGGIPKFVKLEDKTFQIKWEDVNKLISQHTRAIIINTPHNPTASILSAADMQKLEKLLKGRDIIVISDEVYEHIVFDGYEHQSVARYPEIAARSIIVSSFGKTYHTTGWKIGYVLAPSNLMAEFRKVHQYNVFSVNTPVQFAYAEWLKRKDLYIELGRFYQEKRDFFQKLLAGSRFEIYPSLGSYFQVLGYDKITDEKDLDYAKRMTIEAGVAPIPLSVFYNNSYDPKALRFCFAKENDTLEKAAEKLMKL